MRRLARFGALVEVVRDGWLHGLGHTVLLEELVAQARELHGRVHAHEHIDERLDVGRHTLLDARLGGDVLVGPAPGLLEDKRGWSADLAQTGSLPAPWL